MAKVINSKNKGSVFERNVVKLLEHHFPDKKFGRSNGSGAMVGGTNSRYAKNYDSRALELITSDIVCTNGSFDYTIEAKSYKEFDGLTKLIDKSSKIYLWFEQSCRDSKMINKQPLLIFKFNHTKVYLVTFDSNFTEMSFNYIYLDKNIILTLADDCLPYLKCDNSEKAL